MGRWNERGGEETDDRQTETQRGAEIEKQEEKWTPGCNDLDWSHFAREDHTAY